ncbi:hypothetical protein [Mycolicibacterium chubuense]|uniref:hypothetical protein n=1 Tax=Mycolicibacterium chubuense TaxID=1800 RepID=UPI001F41314E|nr:hypothetical protein [Mycolicibacterium chubuense]
MASHSATVAQAAQDHGGRFDRTQQETPRTQAFADTRQNMTRAQMLMMQTSGLMGADQFARYSSHLQQLDTTATTAGVSYHLSELPQAPPPPPPVTDIVNDGASAPSEGSGQPGERKPSDSEDQSDTAASSDTGAAAGATGASDPLADPLADPARILCWPAARARQRWAVTRCSRCCRWRRWFPPCSRVLSVAPWVQ